jgi:hypothetical protein
MPMKIRITSNALAKALEEQGRASPTHGNNINEWMAKRIESADATVAELVAPLCKPIEYALASENGRAIRHALTTYSSILYLAMEAEKLLADRGITKRNRAGTVVTCHPGASGMNDVTTEVELTRTSGGWWLTGVCKVYLYSRQAERRDYVISTTARDDVVRHALRGISVRDHHGWCGKSAAAADQNT